VPAPFVQIVLPALFFRGFTAVEPALGAMSMLVVSVGRTEGIARMNAVPPGASRPTSYTRQRAYCP
jgi:hypothetical protein